MFPSLLSSTQSLNNSTGVTLVIMLDLSELQNLWSTLDTLLNVVKNIINASSDTANLQETTNKRIPSDHPVSFNDKLNVL